MSKSIILSASQIKAIENNATMFMFPIDTKGMKMSGIGLKKDLLQFAPIQKGDEFFVKEEFFECGCENTCTVCDELETNIMYRADGEDEFTENAVWQPASRMQEHQSRYRSECVDVRAIRVHDIVKTEEAQAINPLLLNFRMFIDFYNNQLKEQNINRTYEDNDYLFSVQTKGIEK